MWKTPKIAMPLKNQPGFSHRQITDLPAIRGVGAGARGTRVGLVGRLSMDLVTSQEAYLGCWGLG